LTIVIDTSVLLHFLNEKTAAPIDAGTGKPVTRCAERVTRFVDAIAQTRERVLIPTPVLAEVLVRAADAAPQYVEIIKRQRAFKMVNFDGLAAIETAAIRARLGLGLNNEFREAPRAKIKFDIMIVALAKVNGAHAIYSDDRDIRRLGELVSIRVSGVGDLPLPDPTLFDETE
jgi:predicted nucleic acid-binding protein